MVVRRGFLLRGVGDGRGGGGNILHIDRDGLGSFRGGIGRRFLLVGEGESDGLASTPRWPFAF